MQMMNGYGQKKFEQLPNIKQFQYQLPQIKQPQRKIIPKKVKPILQMPNLLKSPTKLQQLKQQDKEVCQEKSQSIKLLGESLILKSQLNYQDDEQIQEITKENRLSNLEQKIKFQITPLYDVHQLQMHYATLLPAMVSVLVDEDALQQQIGVDLICLVDRSGSMIGEKLKTAQQSLIKLLDFLSEKDRLCIIEFNGYANRLTPLLRVTKERKSYFKTIIRHITADGGTIISSGMKIALNQINSRKYVNNTTSIFILSDGQDDYAIKEVEQLLENFKHPMTIHTFGFGSDHDANMMAELSNLRNGQFYFVHNISLLDEFFVDAFGGLVSAVAENITIIVQSYPYQPFQNICIYQTYGNMWKQGKQHRAYQINLQSLSAGKRKDFVFECYFPMFRQQIEDQQRLFQVIDAKIIFTDIITKQKIEKRANLNVNLFNQNDQNMPQLIQNDIVAAQYLRVKSADMIEFAKQQCENNQYELAQQAIEYTIQKIQENPQVAEQCQHLLNDLYQSWQATQQYNYESYGSSQLTQLSKNYYSQDGLSANFKDGVQLSSVNTYSNSIQETMLSQVKQDKSTFRSLRKK